MNINKSLKNGTNNGLYTLFPAVIDKNVTTLSKMQVQFMNADMLPKDFNKASEMIGELKEFLINCDSYNGR